ncbi:PAS domain S-box-containing protein/diguanylate cyclase (GGDEF)-like protein [Paucimonas lemoignei]|uniref:PAS domain S-box-containing protein/diguanylate cyclase (GGDEF)-like protein n=1 Tax=Paucimonas lemoignei TaxID=29443 RepID=A0A4R3HXG3_PAULE|nr:EAL domain-containing protein [Paucimonas lemoignei]TCS37514.1 PAS domain S-box-containing protein/diguanylate cyclase (GGDEF)-like protein [Paucimonas lemoignei]
MNPHNSSAVRNTTTHFLSQVRPSLFVAIWPILGLLLLQGLWSYTGHQLNGMKQDTENKIRAQVTLSAESYTQQLRQTLEQIDQIALRLKYNSEDPSRQVDLERDKQLGLFPSDHYLYASVFDVEGKPVTSTVSGWKTMELSIKDRSDFQVHASNCCTGLVVSLPTRSKLMGKTVIRFTRRLSKPDGSFAGIVSVAVEPAFLITFQENVGVGDKDFVSVRLTTGPLLATKVGNSRDVKVFYRKNPVFAADSGLLLEPAEKFIDNEARYVAWKKLDKYPVIALSGVAVKSAMAPYYATERHYRDVAIFSSIVIILLSIVAAYVAAGVAKRRRMASEIEETYRLATDAANEGFYMLRPVISRQGYPEDFIIEDCNNRAAELIGTSRDQLTGTRLSDNAHVYFREDMLDLCRQGLEKGLLEDEVRIAQGSPIRASWVYRRVVRSNSGLAITVRDISDAKQQEEALAHLANHDTLTKLPNRHWLNGYLPKAIEQASHGTRRLAIFFIDLDNFKNINDTLGHEAGDELLIQATQRLKDAVRASDHVARLGGDEFVVILNHYEIEEDVIRVAKAIIHTISQPFALESGNSNQVSASIGISLFPQDGQDAESLLKHADIAMYAAKAAGKGRYAFYHAHLSDALILRLSKENALRAAIEKDEFVVHFQPRVGVQSGKLTSMEALVRWERPEYGLIYPSEFIDVAEDIGLITQIGELVIEKVCRQIAVWKAKSLPLVPVSVNVSAQQLKAGALSAFIASCMCRYDVEPRLLEAELTESTVIEKSRIVTNELEALRNLGIKLMIDDFGTGYSSMAQLHRLDVDVLKVDRAFTNALLEDSEGELLFKAIMSMATALDMCVVAEGVETREQLRILANLDCDEIQGFIISKAISAEEMSQLMIKRVLLSSGRVHLHASKEH